MKYSVTSVVSRWRFVVSCLLQNKPVILSGAVERPRASPTYVTAEGHSPQLALHCCTPGAATARGERCFGTSTSNRPPCNVSCSVPSGLAEFHTAPISTFLLPWATLVG